MRSGDHGGIIFRFLFLILMAGLLTLVYLARHPILRAAGGLLVVEDPLEHADAIIVLGDDNYGGDRATRAAQLFRSGLAAEVVASGPMLRPYFGITELIARDLESRGVPASDVLRFDHRGRNTIEEAFALRNFVAAHGWRRVLLVTSNYHTRRARYIYSKVFPGDIAVEVASAPDSDYNPNSWWESQESAELFFHEMIGYFGAMWELRNGSAAEPAGKSAASLPQLMRANSWRADGRLAGLRIFQRFPAALPRAGPFSVYNARGRELYSAPGLPVVLPSRPARLV